MFACPQSQVSRFVSSGESISDTYKYQRRHRYQARKTHTAAKESYFDLGSIPIKLAASAIQPQQFCEYLTVLTPRGKRCGAPSIEALVEAGAHMATCGSTIHAD